MRKDMKKKLVDTFRVGGSLLKKGKKKKNPDVIAARRERIEIEEYEDEEGVHIELSDSVRHSTRTGYRTRDSWTRKDFGENLNPLWRYLQKQVGRNWDAVYAEICEHMDRRSAVGGHIFEHLYTFVTPVKEVRIIDGVPHRAKHYDDGFEPITYIGKIGEGGCFFVDPRDNKLKHGVPPKETERQERLRKIKEDRADRLRKIGEDLWLSRHPETNLWYVLHAIDQEYELVEIRKRPLCAADGVYTKDENGAVVQVKIEPREVHEMARVPEGLFLPKGKVVISCRSASKKDLRSVQ